MVTFFVCLRWVVDDIYNAARYRADGAGSIPPARATPCPSYYVHDVLPEYILTYLQSTSIHPHTLTYNTPVCIHDEGSLVLHVQRTSLLYTVQSVFTSSRKYIRRVTGLGAKLEGEMGWVMDVVEIE